MWDPKENLENRNISESKETTASITNTNTFAISNNPQVPHTISSSLLITKQEADSSNQKYQQQQQQQSANIDSGFLSGPQDQYDITDECCDDDNLIPLNEKFEFKQQNYQQTQPKLIDNTATDSGLIEDADIDQEDSMMIIDSGVDIDVSEKFSRLNLLSSTVPLSQQTNAPNNLGAISKLKENYKKQQQQQQIISNPPIVVQDVHNNKIAQEQSWENYYQQDEEGDT